MEQLLLVTSCDSPAGIGASLRTDERTNGWTDRRDVGNSILDLSYSTTTTLQRTVVFSTTFLIYFVVAANCRYNYDDLLYTANMYIYATTYLSYKRCNLSLSTTIRSRPIFVVLSYSWTTTKVLHICRTKDVI